jgi:hypothetical protein
VQGALSFGMIWDSSGRVSLWAGLGFGAGRDHASTWRSAAIRLHRRNRGNQMIRALCLRLPAALINNPTPAVSDFAVISQG